MGRLVRAMTTEFVNDMKVKYGDGFVIPVRVRIIDPGRFIVTSDHVRH